MSHLQRSTLSLRSFSTRAVGDGRGAGFSRPGSLAEFCSTLCGPPSARRRHTPLCVHSTPNRGIPCTELSDPTTDLVKRRFPPLPTPPPLHEPSTPLAQDSFCTRSSRPTRRRHGRPPMAWGACQRRCAFVPAWPLLRTRPCLEPTPPSAVSAVATSRSTGPPSRRTRRMFETSPCCGGSACGSRGWVASRACRGAGSGSGVSGLLG